MRILNLFCGIGGNRTLWGNKHEITAIDNNQQIALIYHKRFPNDKVIITDAYEYFLEYFEEFDFVWASPPCQSHSRLVRPRMGNRRKTGLKETWKARLPDLRLYSLIIFLKELYRGDWLVENVKSYYKPLIPPTTEVGRHWVWTNIPLLPLKKEDNREIFDDWKKCMEIKGLDPDLLNIINGDKRAIARNCVKPEIGKYILDSITNQKQLSIEVFSK